MATNAEKIEQMMSRLGQRTSQRVRTDLVAELNTAIEHLETQPFIPWFLRTTSFLTLPEGSTVVSLPSNYLREREEFLPYYSYDGTNYYIEKRLLGALPGFKPIISTPEVYAIDGGQFHFRPAAPEEIEVTFTHYSRSNDPVLDNDEEVTNPWLIEAFEYVSCVTLKNIATFHVQNLPLGEIFASLEFRYYGQLYKYHESRIHEGQDYYVGGASGT